ncbi:MAG: DNA polymerase III subunit alpha [Clostridia bacterium]|nr:DNA polymerase III subunit alpha [Clostridia bacterium]
MGDFVHLHIHSEFSLLDGANRIKDIPVRAKELGMDSIAITDHGVMYGVIDFYKACKKEGIKPIIGCEVYVSPRSRFDKENGKDNKYNHLILLAKNMQGYRNLSKLVSIGFTEGYYYKPRIDLEVLEKYSEGLVCLSACLAGAVNQALLNGNEEEAERIALWHKNVFGEDYYIEIQNNGLKEQVLANQKLVKLARKLDIPLVATNDAHYLKKEDAYNHEVLLCIQTGKRMSDVDRMKFDTEELYIKSPEEMIEYFKAFPDAIENTVKIAEKCNVEFEFGHTILPNYDVPEGYATHYDYIEKLCYDGIKNRYGENPSQEILDRAKYELGVVKNMGYVDYFLIVWDFIHYAKEHGIPVGPGRGSGAGSILAYAIEITDIDPIKYNLLFERFLNPERISMPDFDVDFSDEQRQEVIDYVSKKYGHDHVAQIITFGTLAAKNAIRNVGRALDVSLQETDKIAKMVPNELHITIKKAIEENVELRNLYESDERIKQLLDVSMALEGMPKNTSTHACGVVITKDPVDTYVPLYERDGQISTQYIMTTLEELGLLKMDFLGLRTLSVIKNTEELVKQTQGIDVEFDQKMDDPEVYKLWQEGKSCGIFQFESQGMTNFMQELKPDCLEDLIAGVSLYRPGPMDQIPRYIKGKLTGEYEYTHPSLEPILKVTYGCMVYQEQVMQIVRDLAGYSLGRADLVRRAMGKKKLDVMAKEREVFINGQVDENGNIEVPGCVRNGIDAESANKIFDEMAEFAKYAFNKSHAACYAVVAYRTAYLKRYYPAEFMAAMLNSYLGNLDKVPVYIDECNSLNIKILKPDINRSFLKFTVDNGDIRFGLGSIKNVGSPPIEAIIKEREANGPFESFTDFCERISDEAVNKKCIESLIKAGAFDEFEQTRATLLASFETIVDTIQSGKKKGLEGQFSMFDLGTEEESNLDELKYNFTEKEELSERELLSLEKEMLGIYLSGHPLEKLKEQIEAQTNINTMDMAVLDKQMANIEDDESNIEALVNNYPASQINKSSKFKDGQEVIYAGIISKVKKKFTKNNKIMAFVTVEDSYGQAEVLAFENVYIAAGEALMEENIVMIKGRLSVRDGEKTTIIAREITNFGVKKRNVLILDITGVEEEVKVKLRGAIKFFTGDMNNIPVQIKDEDKILPCGAIYCTDRILNVFYDILGQEKVNIKEI